MGLTDEQRALRRSFIGGSDAPALAGVNPPSWSQPIDVYLDKIGQAPPRREHPLMAMGTLMEDLVFGLAAEATGITWRRAAHAVRSRQYPWAGGHVDRYGTDRAGVPVVGEAKWAMRSAGWGPSWQAVDANGDPVAGADAVAYLAPDAGTQVPPHYAVQVQHYLAVTGRPAGVLAVLLGYADFRWYLLPRNEDVIASLMAVEETFWREYVVAGVPPPPDGSTGYTAALRSRYASDDGTEAVATAAQQALVDTLRLAQVNLGAASAQYELARQAVMDSMGTTQRLVGPGWRINWARRADALKVRWEGLATDLLHLAYPDAPTDRQALVAQAAPPDWPTTKKARAAVIRDVARALGHADAEPGTRPFEPEFDDQEGPDAATQS